MLNFESLLCALQEEGLFLAQADQSQNTEIKHALTSNVNQKITVTKDDWLSNYSAATIAKANKDLALANDQLKKANLLFYGGITLAALDLLFFIPKLRIGIYKTMSFHPAVNPNGVIMANMNIKF